MRDTAADGSATPATTSTSRSSPSRLPRSRRSGQVPSWTPGTATTRHSRPRAACAVSSATASASGAWAARVSPGSCWSARYSTNAATSAPGSRSACRAAASNRARTASRSRSAAAPTGPPSALAVAPARSASDVPRQIRHSTCSALSPSRIAAPATASSSPTRRSGAVSWAGARRAGPAGPGRRRAGPRRAAGRCRALLVRSRCVGLGGRCTPPAAARSARPARVRSARAEPAGGPAARPRAAAGGRGAAGAGASGPPRPGAR